LYFQFRSAKSESRRKSSQLPYKNFFTNEPHSRAVIPSGARNLLSY
jgi:hypothetical protein